MLAQILSNEKNSDFAISMVDILNTILLTSPELFDLRNRYLLFYITSEILMISSIQF